MRILGIETSCDETAIAVIDVTGPAAKPRLRVLSNIVASQVKLHAKFGGVVPHLAKREHQENLVPVLLTALRQAGLSQRAKRKANGGKRFAIGDVRLAEILERDSDLFARMVPKVLPLRQPKLDVIAVTVGPGLAPALWVGVNFARALAYLWEQPLIPVNHLEGHIYTNLLSREGLGHRGQGTAVRRPIPYPLTPIPFPALCLIVSGGHTELVLIRGYGRYQVIGETLDDAAGEAFDKVAKMLGLGFPGGPPISHLAAKGDPRAIAFPRPMLHSRDFNFSFSGLKTAVLYYVRQIANRKAHGGNDLRFTLSDQQGRDVAASFEQAVADVLVAKTIRAARQHRAKTVMIGGGVAANQRLRAELGEALTRLFPKPYTLFPNPSLTGDNALMIALAGWFNRGKKRSWRNISVEANLRLDSP